MIDVASIDSCSKFVYFFQAKRVFDTRENSLLGLIEIKNNHLIRRRRITHTGIFSFSIIMIYTENEKNYEEESLIQQRINFRSRFV